MQQNHVQEVVLRSETMLSQEVRAANREHLVAEQPFGHYSGTAEALFRPIADRDVDLGISEIRNVARRRDAQLDLLEILVEAPKVRDQPFAPSCWKQASIKRWSTDCAREATRPCSSDLRKRSWGTHRSSPWRTRGRSSVRRTADRMVRWQAGENAGATRERSPD